MDYQDSQTHEERLSKVILFSVGKRKIKEGDLIGAFN